MHMPCACKGVTLKKRTLPPGGERFVLIRKPRKSVDLTP